MGITRGQLRKLGFKKVNKEDLFYTIKCKKDEHFMQLPFIDNEYLVLGKGKTVIFYIKDDISTPLVHLNFVTYTEMLDFLKNLKDNSIFKLKNQIEEI